MQKATWGPAKQNENNGPRDDKRLAFAKTKAVGPERVQIDDFGSQANQVCVLVVVAG